MQLCTDCEVRHCQNKEGKLRSISLPLPGNESHAGMPLHCEAAASSPPHRPPGCTCSSRASRALTDGTVYSQLHSADVAWVWNVTVPCASAARLQEGVPGGNAGHCCSKLQKVLSSGGTDLSAPPSLWQHTVRHFKISFLIPLLIKTKQNKTHKIKTRTHTEREQSVCFQSHGGKSNEAASQSAGDVARCGYFLITSCWWQRCTRLSLSLSRLSQCLSFSPSLLKAQSKPLIGAKFPCMMQPGAEWSIPHSADENLIHLFLGDYSVFFLWERNSEEK